MTYYEFTCKVSLSEGKPALSGIVCAPDHHPVGLVESAIAGALNVPEVTLDSPKLDLESEFKRRRELAASGSVTNGQYANLGGVVEVIIR
jgi:hypothetical protein